MIYHNTLLKIDLDAIRDNFRAICQKAGVPVMAVVKADAYGHGAVQVARLLEKDCAFFGVSSVSEALELRRAGLCKPILILGHTPKEAFPDIIKEGIRPALFDYDDALALSREAQKQGLTAPFHFAVDTGMSRIGFQVSREAAETCARIAALPNLVAEGLFSHFATADMEDLSQARAQADRFAEFSQMLARLGLEIPLRHMDNSAGVMNFENHYDMVRAGIVIYGLYPSDAVDPGLLKLRPALSWHSHISHIKVLPAGRQISYGGTYTTQRDTSVATIPAGYADGYRRSLSNRFYVLIRGCKAPILGRICMDQLMVDVTDIPGAAVGDSVVLIGTDGQQTITVEEVAAAADTFNYELVCGISRRTPRRYIQDGKISHTVNYLLP